MDKKATTPLPTPEEFLRKTMKLEGDKGELRIDQLSYMLGKYTKQVVHYALQQAAENAKLSHKTEETKTYLGRAVNSWSEVDKQSILSLEEQIIKNLGL